MADQTSKIPFKHHISSLADLIRSGSLDLSYCDPVTSLSALATARVIGDINEVSYPEGIKSPIAKLNINSKEGKFV